jgi:carbon starvation protein CstA
LFPEQEPTAETPDRPEYGGRNYVKVNCSAGFRRNFVTLTGIAPGYGAV